MLFISETPTATFSSRRRSGGVHGTPKSAVRGILAWLISDVLLWAGLGVRMYPTSTNWSATEKIMFSWHFSKVIWCFFLAENTGEKKRKSNDQKEKRGWEKPALHSLFLSLTEKCHIDCLSGYFVNTSSRTDLAVCSNHSKIQIT